MVLKQLFGKKTGDQKSVVAHDSAAASTQAERQGASADTAVKAADEPAAAEYLEQAMFENARNDNPDSRKKVYQELLFGDLLLALAEPDTEAEKNDPSNLSVAILTNSAGVPFAAAFTSSAAARRWRAEGGNYVSIRGQDIYKLLEPSPAEVIVINAGSAPFIVLPKVEFKQLALGIVPQTGRSPVQINVGSGETPEQEGANPQDGQMQLAFPPDVFTEEQKAVAREVMEVNPSIEAAVLGAILPPGAEKDAWVRTVFLRVIGIEENQDAMQQFCVEVRKLVSANEELFKDVGFEVGVMPDPNFWVHMHQNGITLFDKNPPALPVESSETGVQREGVVDALNDGSADAKPQVSV